MAEHVVPAIVIPLTRGFVAIIDEEDAEAVLAHSWHAHGKGHHVYGARQLPGMRGCQLLHRLVTNAPDGMDVDHINGNTLDNRKSNLRVCTHAENMLNLRQDKSRFCGVYFEPKKNRWRAEIRIKGSKHRLGRYKDREEAERAYREAAEKLEPL